MNRYTDIKIKKRFDGKRVYSSVTYPIILPSDNDVIITTNESDYLDSLAYKYYKDSSLWWILALANNLGKGRLSIPAGTRLRVPSNVNAIINTFKKLNS